MRYIVTGGAGNISKPLIGKLLKAGHEVIAVARNADHLKELTMQGAKQSIGSIEDVEFLKKTFAGADAVYTMVPPNFTTTDLKKWMRVQGENGEVLMGLDNLKEHCGEQFKNKAGAASPRMKPGFFFSNHPGYPPPG